MVEIWVVSRLRVFRGKADRIRVSNGDGCKIAEELPNKPRLVFCDPFWTDEEESQKVQSLLKEEAVVVVWYPLSKNTVAYRNWQQTMPYSFIELEFVDYRPRKGGWAGQDMKGAGLTIKGLPPRSLLRSLEIGIGLKSIFDSHADKGRHFDLKVTVSCQK